MVADLPNIIWPEDPDPNPGFFARLGRLIHWGLTVGALAAAGFAISGHDYENLWTAFWLFVGGRAVRFLLSGE